MLDSHWKQFQTTKHAISLEKLRAELEMQQFNYYTQAGSSLSSSQVWISECHALRRQSEQDLRVIIIGLNKLFKNCLLCSNSHQTVLRRVKLALISQYKDRIWLRITEIAACMRFKNEFHCLVGTADQNLTEAGLLLSYCSPQFQSTLGITSGEHYMTYTKELESCTEKRNRARLYQSLVSWCSPDLIKSFIQLKL